MQHLVIEELRAQTVADATWPVRASAPADAGNRASVARLLLKGATVAGGAE